MTVSWDRALVEELSGRRVIVFLGAGATKSCVRNNVSGVADSTPSWPQLLELLTAASSCSDDDREHLNSLTSKERFLDAAQIIKENISTQEYSRILRQEFRNIETGTLHDSIVQLDQRIVMTTNYDSAYEDLCTSGSGRDGFAVVNYYDSGLINQLRSPMRVILKLHGSVKQPERTVLTRTQYFQARADNPRVFSLVEALFATHTLLFVGYSLSDPDIQLLLETSNIGGPDSFRHYALVPAGIHKAVSRAMSESYGINIIEYDATNGHEAVATSISELAGLVEEVRSPI